MAAEPADYVHIYEMEGGAATREQEIDIFGEVSGVALSPCGGMLYVGVSGATCVCCMCGGRAGQA